MSEILLDARLVVGGIWPGAPRAYPTCVTVGNDEDGGGWLAGLEGTDDGEPAVWEDDGPPLLLPGPLGLGAAGLAVRIAHRLAETVDELRVDIGQVLALADHKGVPVPGDWRSDTHAWPAALKAVSEYLAATDALCAAVGLELEAGEVAGWKPVGVGPGGQNRCWELRTGDGETVYFNATGSAELMRQGCEQRSVRALSTTGDDPRESLLACWREVCDE